MEAWKGSNAASAPVAPPAEFPAQPACSATCTGGVSPELHDALRDVAKNVGAQCYDLALRTKNIRGSMKVFVQVEASGSTCRIHFEHSNADVAVMEACIRDLFERARFPAPTGGCVRVGVPLSFAPAPAQPRTDGRK